MSDRTARPKLVTLEFNELCPSLLTRWMAEGLLPNFAALHAASEVWVTAPDVDDAALLEPWIQWYSIHTGLPYDTHRVFHLTDGAKAGHRDVFAMLRDAGRSVASFASMNVAPFAGEDALYLGDPWTEQGDAHPPAYNAYNRFVSSQVREYSNASQGLGAADYLRFGAFMASHGLSADTVRRIAAQLAAEKTGDARLSWKRVQLLDQLQFDVFRAAWRQRRPDFATFFSNSVAHVQHSYWRHMDPDAFTVRPDAGELAVYGHAVRDAYIATDRLLGRFRKLAAAEGITLMFATALSQQPFLRHEETGGQHFYRLHDVTAFLKDAAIAFAEVKPTMTHQYMLRCADPAARDAAKATLAGYRLADGRQVFGFPPVEGDPAQLYFGCQISSATPSDTVVLDGAGREVGFGSLFYRIAAIKSGRHHPDGCLWIQSPRPRVHGAKASILDILPTQLAMLGVDVPTGLSGQNLLAEHADRAAA